MGLDQSPMIVSEEAASLLREYVAGERGQKLRTQLASKHPNRSSEEIEEAVQTACKCFLEEADGIEAPGQVYTWIRTAAHHALNREEEHRGWVDPVDPTGRDLAVAVTQDPSPEQEAITNEEEAELLRRMADQANAQAVNDERLLDELAGTLGRACQLRIEQLDRRLRGQRLQEIAVEILASRLAPGETIHYKQWFSWVEAEGFRVGGKNPQATFLAQVARSPRVVSAGRRSGRYGLVEVPA